MGLRKTNIEGGLPKKGVAQFAYLRGGLGKKEGGGVFFLRGGGGRGVDNPMHTMKYTKI